MSIGGNVYNQDYIADPVYSSAAPNHGMYGIATASFTCDIFTGAGSEASILQLAPCSSVIFSELSDTEFVLTAASFRSKGVVSITAYTKFINSDIVMTADTFIERSAVTGKLQTYSCQRVVMSALGAISGTGGSPAAIGDNPYLYVSEFKGKTARSVLEEISKVNGGYFFENRGVPDFAVNGGGSKGLLSVNADEYSVCSPEQTKTISHVYVTDSLSNDVYEVGSGENYNTETLSGDYLIGETVCRQAAAKMLGQYVGWSCANILADSFIPVLHTTISFDGDKRIADNITIKFTKNHSVLSAGADSFQMSFTDYTDQKQRAIDSKLAANKTYNGAGFNTDFGFYFTMQDSDNGITALSDSAERNENYYFSTQSGGFTQYDGIMSSSKEASSVDIDIDTSGVGTVTETYADGHIYKYSAVVTETSTGYKITNETEEWT